MADCDVISMAIQGSHHRFRVRFVRESHNFHHRVRCVAAGAIDGSVTFEAMIAAASGFDTQRQPVFKSTGLGAGSTCAGATSATDDAGEGCEAKERVRVVAGAAAGADVSAGCRRRRRNTPVLAAGPGAGTGGGGRFPIGGLSGVIGGAAGCGFGFLPSDLSNAPVSRVGIGRSGWSGTVVLGQRIDHGRRDHHDQFSRRVVDILRFEEMLQESECWQPPDSCS